MWQSLNRAAVSPDHHGTGDLHKSFLLQLHFFANSIYHKLLLMLNYATKSVNFTACWKLRGWSWKRKKTSYTWGILLILIPIRIPTLTSMIQNIVTVRVQTFHLKRFEVWHVKCLTGLSLHSAEHPGKCCSVNGFIKVSWARPVLDFVSAFPSFISSHDLLSWSANLSSSICLQLRCLLDKLLLAVIGFCPLQGNKTLRNWERWGNTDSFKTL